MRADDCTGARINQARGCAFHDNWRVPCQRRSMTLFSSRLPRRRPGRGRTKASAARAGAIDKSVISQGVDPLFIQGATTAWLGLDALHALLNRQ